MWYGQDTYPFWDSVCQPWNGNNTVYLTGFLRGFEIIYKASSTVFGNNRSSENGNNHQESSRDFFSSFKNVYLIRLKFYSNMLFGFFKQKWHWAHFMAHFMVRETATGSLALSEKLLGLVSIQSAFATLASPLPAPMELSWDIHTGFSPIYGTGNLPPKHRW